MALRRQIIHQMRAEKARAALCSTSTSFTTTTTTTTTTATSTTTSTTSSFQTADGETYYSVETWGLTSDFQEYFWFKSHRFGGRSTRSFR